MGSSHSERRAAHNARTGKYSKQATRTEANKRKKVLRSNGAVALAARIQKQYGAKAAPKGTQAEE